MWVFLGTSDRQLKQGETGGERLTVVSGVLLSLSAS
jgi:hypothetical protein